MIVGRERESALIEDFLRHSGRSSVLIVRGDAGLGKTVLIEDAVRRSQPESGPDGGPDGSDGSDGGMVLRAHGYQGATTLPFAALHQLLRPVLGGLDALPARERAALRAAFAMDSGGRPVEWAEVAPATLALLSGLDGGVLLVVDDAQWCDRASLEVVGSVARSSNRAAARGGRPVTVLAGARGPAPAPLAVGAAELLLRPLPAEAADLLLSLQPGPPPEPLARLLLREAGGNPLAIIELAKATGSWAGVAVHGPGETLPLTEHLEKFYGAQLEQLPPAARDLVVTMSAAGDGEWPAILAALKAGGLQEEEGLPDGMGAATSIAVDAGLVALPGDGATGQVFRYPLIRSAVYRTISCEERRRAHLRLARILKNDPDRRARHLAAAADGPDEEVAALLEAAAHRAEERGAPAEARTAMERAAHLTLDPRARARRLVKAARVALYLEQAGKVEELIATVKALTDDPGVLALLPSLVGWVISTGGRQDAAMALLIPAAEDAAGHAPSAALTTLGMAARVVFYSGRRAHREQIKRVLGLLTAKAGPDDGPAMSWVTACTDLLAARDGVRAALERELASPGRDFVDRLLLGMMAAFGDFPEAAVDLLAPLLDPEQEIAPAGGNSAFLTMYGFACLETGRWKKAESVAERAVRICAEIKPGVSAAQAQSLRAILAALRGHAEEARALAHQTLAGTDAQNRLVTVRCERALGLAATAEGSHEAAYNHFRHLFTSGGEPVHDHHSYHALADLAGAAALTGHVEDAARVIDAADADLAGRRSERLDLLIGTARGLLAHSDEDASRHFEAALAGCPPGQWPFERARAHLEYGQRLRRHYQIQHAREELAAALDIFERLGAQPWTERARIELRAAGVRSDGPAQSRLDLLTAQELQIVRLAGQGLTNKEIGERLFLSHRTVSSHLYRIFPKLGVSTRAQLHTFIGDGEAVD
ncbi:AAA family ATPase [Nonomuraea sp. NPDC050404]|uniref:helix-turn-helix transcriptional regulator n=1 Tax=Nonomuraea sp. NPDC050404 TaxID=3155783 RepID=UPI0033D3BC28